MKWKNYGILENGKIVNRYTTLQKAKNGLEYMKKNFISSGKIIELDNSNRFERKIIK